MPRVASLLISLGLLLAVAPVRAQGTPTLRSVAIFTLGQVTTEVRDSIAHAFERALQLAAPESKEELTSERTINKYLDDYVWMPERGGRVSLADTRAIGQTFRARIVGQLYVVRSSEYVRLSLQLVNVADLTRTPVSVEASARTIAEAAQGLARVTAPALGAELRRTPR